MRLLLCILATMAVKAVQTVAGLRALNSAPAEAKIEYMQAQFRSAIGVSLVFVVAHLVGACAPTTSTDVRSIVCSSIGVLSFLLLPFVAMYLASNGRHAQERELQRRRDERLRREAERSAGGNH